MNDAVRYLLPAIPSLLYGGLGRHQVERLAVLRKACERIWERRALGRLLAVDFASLFQDVLSQFDMQPEGFATACRTNWWARWPSYWRRTTTRWRWRSTIAKAASVR